MALIRTDRASRCSCDKCGGLSWPAPLDMTEKLLESLARQGWRFIDPADGQAETLCATCMKAEPPNAR